MRSRSGLRSYLWLVCLVLAGPLLSACPKSDSTVGRVMTDAQVTNLEAGVSPGGADGSLDARRDSTDAGQDGTQDGPVGQHPYVSTGASCVDYPDVGYRVFPIVGGASTGGGQSWPVCPLNCTQTMATAGAGVAPLDQALPAGPCDDEGATCNSPLMAGWSPPCTNSGGPGNGYTCVCRSKQWHCADVSQGMNVGDPPACINPSLTPPCGTTTWSTTQVCACGACRDLCSSDAECASGHCIPNQVCRAPSSCPGPDECAASCTGLCAPVSLDGGLTSGVDGPGAGPGDGLGMALESSPAFDGLAYEASAPNSAVHAVTTSTSTCSDGRVLRVTEFPLASTDTDAEGIAAGPDGNVWFAECFVNKIGRITSDGTLTEFSAPTLGACPMGITAGPDGNLWFTELYAGQIGRITPQGTITEFAIPTPDGWPNNITVGPDGNLWFTERQGNKIGRIGTGGKVEEFAVPPADIAPQTHEPWDIAAGADGKLWFTYGPNIGQASTTGAVVLFPVPTQGADTGGITAGPDGNLWFTEVPAYASDPTHSIGRVTPQATITELTGPEPGGVPGDIVAGPDGSLWFTEAAVRVDSGRLVGRMHPDGTFAMCPARRANIGASAIAVGPDGNLWLTEPGEIIRIEPIAPFLSSSRPSPSRGSIPRDLPE